MAMARVARLALDLSLVSMRKARPVISKAWGAAKSFASTTPLKTVLNNNYITKLEIALDNGARIAEIKIHDLGDKLLPSELKYLEEEIQKVKQRINESTSYTTCRSLRPRLGVVWQYAKVECAPPMTKAFLQGSACAKFEEVVAKSVDGFITKLAEVIHRIDVAEAQAKADKEAALKKELADKETAKKEKKRLEALQKVQKMEAEKKAQQEKAAKETKATASKADAKTEEKPKEMRKTKEKKPKKASKKPKKVPPKKKK